MNAQALATCHLQTNMNFYPVPPVIEAQVLTRIPDTLRCRGESDWRGGFTGNFQNIFLEGPTCDEDGNLFVTDIPYGRILKVNQHNGDATVCVQYDGEPNGMARRKDGKIIVADYKKVSGAEAIERGNLRLITRKGFSTLRSKHKRGVESAHKEQSREFQGSQ